MTETETLAATIRPAYREGRNGQPVRRGWHLIVNDEWWQTYATKTEAREAALAAGCEIVK